MNGPNLYTREIPIAPSDTPIMTFYNDPVQARAMDKQDIADLRRWYRNAALRCRKMEFDLVCIYAAHGFGAPQHFLSRRYNHRSDEYGGSLENRTRLLREITEDVKVRDRRPLRRVRARQHGRTDRPGGLAQGRDA